MRTVKSVRYECKKTSGRLRWVKMATSSSATAGGASAAAARPPAIVVGERLPCAACRLYAAERCADGLGAADGAAGGAQPACGVFLLPSHGHLYLRTLPPPPPAGSPAPPPAVAARDPAAAHRILARGRVLLPSASDSAVASHAGRKRQR